MVSTTSGRNRLWRHIRRNDPFAASPLRQTPYLVVTLFIAIVHFGFAALGKFLIVEKSPIMPAFPGLGFDLTVLLVFGPRYWPILLAFYFRDAVSRYGAWLPSSGVAFASLTRTFVTVALVR